jgi:hypothetical protein
VKQQNNDNTMNRISIAQATVSPGPLFEVTSPDGDVLHLYHVATQVVTSDGRHFVHEYQPFGRGAEAKALAFCAKVSDRGSIDLSRGWLEIFPSSLEDRLGQFGEQWQHEAEERFAATGSIW